MDEAADTREKRMRGGRRSEKVLRNYLSAHVCGKLKKNRRVGSGNLLFGRAGLNEVPEEGLLRLPLRSKRREL